MRTFITACLRRPVAVIACYVLAMVLAAVAVIRLPVTLLPDLGFPALTVWTAYPDVSPRQVEQAVTEPVEQALAGAEGLLEITSRSQLGGSVVNLRFDWNTNLNLALLNAREQIARLGEALPEEAARPVILRVDPSDRPIMMIAVRLIKQREAADSARSDHKVANSSVQETAPQALVGLRRLAREVVARRLEQLQGVARVRVTGGYERQINVMVGADRLAAYGVSLAQVAGALRATNVTLPGGVIRRGPFRYAVEVSGEFNNTSDVAQTVIARSAGAPIRLEDVATVESGVTERRGLVRLNGRETLLLLVERTADANTVTTAEQVRASLQELHAELSGVRMDVVVDESRFIEAAISGVTKSVILGGILAVLVLLLFLRRPRALLAVGLAVPLSLGITLVLFDLFEVSFNLIAISGLALGVGMLVDNAIVVFENITRLREQGQAAFAAAIEGTQEVAGAITASTLTTCAVFLPLTFVEGLAGRLFRDQSLAVVCSLMASLVVALTVVPLIASRARRNDEEAEHNPRTRGLLGAMLDRYERGLAWSLDHRRHVLAMATGLFVVTAFLAWNLPREVVPETDQGRVNVHLALHPGAALPLLAARSAEISTQARNRGWANQVLADLGVRDEARLALDPRPPYEGDLTLVLATGVSAAEAMDSLRALTLPRTVEMDISPARTQLEALLTTGGGDLYLNLITENRAPARRAAERLLPALRERPELANVRMREAAQVPAYELTFNERAMARFGVTPSTLAAYLEASARGRRATELRTVNEEIPVVIKAEAITSIDDLFSQRIPTRDGLLPMQVFVDARPVELPAALIRSDQAPVVQIVADAQGDLAAAVEAVEETTAEILPVGMQHEISGANEAFRRSMTAVIWSLLLSLLLVYLILAAEFESLSQPLVNLATVLLAAAGVALVLWLTGQTINLMSLTGCVVLVGIVDNNAVIQIDLINQRRERGMALREAVLSGCRDRMRPILMTTITTVLGLLPMALSLGAGSALRAPLAIAIAGGLVSATVLTLFVVPVLYTYVVRC